MPRASPDTTASPRARQLAPRRAVRRRARRRAARAAPTIATARSRSAAGVAAHAEQRRRIGERGEPRRIRRAIPTARATRRRARARARPARAAPSALAAPAPRRQLARAASRAHASAPARRSATAAAVASQSRDRPRHGAVGELAIARAPGIGIASMDSAKAGKLPRLPRSTRGHGRDGACSARPSYGACARGSGRRSCSSLSVRVTTATPSLSRARAPPAASRPRGPARATVSSRVRSGRVVAVRGRPRAGCRPRGRPSCRGSGRRSRCSPSGGARPGKKLILPSTPPGVGQHGDLRRQRLARHQVVAVARSRRATSRITRARGLRRRSSTSSQPSMLDVVAEQCARYRGRRPSRCVRKIVNWSPTCDLALAEADVDVVLLAQQQRARAPGRRCWRRSCCSGETARVSRAETRERCALVGSGRERAPAPASGSSAAGASVRVAQRLRREQRRGLVRRDLAHLARRDPDVVARKDQVRDSRSRRCPSRSTATPRACRGRRRRCPRACRPCDDVDATLAARGSWPTAPSSTGARGSPRRPALAARPGARKRRRPRRPPRSASLRPARRPAPRRRRATGSAASAGARRRPRSPRPAPRGAAASGASAAAGTAASDRQQQPSGRRELRGIIAAPPAVAPHGAHGLGRYRRPPSGLTPLGPTESGRAQRAAACEGGPPAGLDGAVPRLAPSSRPARSEPARSVRTSLAQGGSGRAGPPRARCASRRLGASIARSSRRARVVLVAVRLVGERQVVADEARFGSSGGCRPRPRAGSRSPRTARRACRAPSPACRRRSGCRAASPSPPARGRARGRGSGRVPRSVGEVVLRVASSGSIAMAVLVVPHRASSSSPPAS